MISIHLQVQDEQYSKVKALSKKTGAPVNELIRRALDDYLKKQSKKQRAYLNEREG